MIYWFRSYLSSRKFHVNVTDNVNADLRCGVPQESILGPMLFLLYTHDMPQAVHCDLFPYVDDTCSLHQHKDLERLKEELTENFLKINLKIYVTGLRIISCTFTSEKIKLNLSYSQPKPEKKNIGTIDINYGDIKIKQYSKEKYLGCELDENLSGDAMVLKVFNKVNGWLRLIQCYNSTTF